ncbi:MAG: hypothetical protein ACLQBQ_13275 [Smithella sp.]
MQVSAVKTQKRATIHKEQLVVTGFPTYTIPAYVRGTSWIPVRTRFFKSKRKSREIGEKIWRTVAIFKGQY